jgi:hypothetical protein
MNWGYKLTVTFIVFACMMSYLVYRSFNTNFDLVEKEYYKSELKYQEVIDGSANANKLSSAPQLVQSGGNIILQMPDEMRSTQPKGVIQFYCSYNAAQDKKIRLQTDANGRQVISSPVSAGNYIAKFSWTYADKNYYTEKQLIIQ